MKTGFIHMKFGKKISILLLIFGLIQAEVNAQDYRIKTRKQKAATVDSLMVPDGPIDARIIHGKVFSQVNAEPLPLATIYEEGTQNGTQSDIDGSFSLKVNLTKPCKLVCTYLGYKNEQILLNGNSSYVPFKLEEVFQVKQDVVISASRKLERKFESPVSIEMMSINDIKNNPGLNLYDRIGNMAGIDIITTSITFKTFNTRGFNSSYNHRFIQRFDNMDLSMPGFNLSIGMLNGPIDLDVERTELIPGSSSALYGANAITGLLNSISKSPYQHKGISAQLKTGVNHIDGIDNKAAPLVDFSMRMANTLKDERWAYKFTLSYMSATDWKATDYSDNANYTFSNNLSTYGFSKGKGNPGYEAANISGDEVTSIFDSSTFKVPIPGGGSIALVNAPLKVSRTGYREIDLFTYKPYSAKSDIALFFRPNKHTEISWTSRLGSGTTNFQIDSRAQISDFFIQQHKFEIKGKNYGFRSYVLFENTGSTYDATVTAININSAAKSNTNWMAQYIFAFSGYYNILNASLGNPTDTIQKFNDAAARKFADGDNSKYAAYVRANGIDSTLSNLLLGRAQFQPGTKEFDSAFNYSATHTHKEGGSMIWSTSKSWYTEFIFNPKSYLKWMNLEMGISYRLNAPNTHGSVFNDQLRLLYSNEIGSFIQGSKNYFDNRLKLQASARLDKTQRFDPKISPRASIVYLAGKKRQHSFRASGQIGFRMPALVDQFNYLDFPGALTIGGFYKDAENENLVRKSVEGGEFVNVYYQNSVNAFLNTGDSSKLIKPVIKNIVPEELRSIEIGWRTFLFEKLETDFNIFVSHYKNLISTQQFIGPINRSDTINATYLKNPAQTMLYRMPANSSIPITAAGFTISANYYLFKNLFFYGNYNYNKLFESKAFQAQDFISNFNTPVNKYNLGVSLLKLKKVFSITANFKWVDQIEFKEYNKIGLVPAYHTLDMMVSYELTKQKIVLKLGGTNITNNRYVQALGSPTVGAVYYFSILFDDMIK